MFQLRTFGLLGNNQQAFLAQQGWCGTRGVCVVLVLWAWHPLAGVPQRLQAAMCTFLPRPHDYSEDGFNDWAFMTTHSWDEDPSGEWVLEIENTSEANNYGLGGCLRAGGPGEELAGSGGGGQACSRYLLTSATPLNRDADQVHPRALWHGP